MQHKFNIGDKVYLEGDLLRPWFVIGVVMRPSYDLICWTYHIGRAVYGDYPMSAFGGRCDVETKGAFREEQIVTEEDRLRQRKEELDSEIQATEKRLQELKAKALERDYEKI